MNLENHQFFVIKMGFAVLESFEFRERAYVPSCNLSLRVRISSRIFAFSGPPVPSIADGEPTNEEALRQ